MKRTSLLLAALLSATTHANDQKAHEDYAYRLGLLEGEHQVCMKTYDHYSSSYATAWHLSPAILHELQLAVTPKEIHPDITHMYKGGIKHSLKYHDLDTYPACILIAGEVSQHINNSLKDINRYLKAHPIKSYINNVTYPHLTF